MAGAARLRQAAGMDALEHLLAAAPPLDDPARAAWNRRLDALVAAQARALIAAAGVLRADAVERRDECAVHRAARMLADARRLKGWAEG